MRAWLADIIDDSRLALTGPAGRWRAVRFARGLPGGVILTLLCLAVYLPGLTIIPPVDRDEARFAQASRQMFESVALAPDARDPDLHAGGLVVPMLAERPRLNKPPLIYWAQAASAWILTAGDPARDAVWMYRLPSALFALVAVLITWRLGCSMFDPRAGLLGAALLAVCPMLVWDAHQARADQLLLACTTAAMWALWKIHRRRARSRRWALFLWAALALGILAKGPITPMIVGLAAFTLSISTRRWRWLARTRPRAGAAILAALVLPWLIAVVVRTGWGEYWAVIADETLGRSGSAKEGHWGPPGYHLLMLVVLFWPGVLLTALSIARATRRAWGQAPETDLPPAETQPECEPTDEPPAPPRRIDLLLASARRLLHTPRGRRAELFCLAWILPAWLVFEFIATKLPHYTLPLYPPIALLTARGLLAAASGALPAYASGAALLGHRVWLGVGAVLIAAPVLAAAFLGGFTLVLASILIAAVAGEALRRAWLCLRAGRPVGAQLWSIAAAVACLAGTLGIVLPNAHRLWISPRLVEVIDLTGDAPIAAVGFHEDSLVFLTRGRLERIDDAEAWLRAHRSGFLITPAGEIDPTSPALPTLTELARVRGYNYSRGRPVHLIVYRVEP